MKTLVEIIENADDAVFFDGASEEDILKAEEELALKFSQEYREYLGKYGLASFGEHELTGICKSERLNVVDATREEKGKYLQAEQDWYMVEKTGDDGGIIWQNEAGQVYLTIREYNPKKIGDSLSDYLN